MRFLFERCKLVVEPSGAAALAGVFAFPQALPERVGVILSGGNLDFGTYDEFEEASTTDDAAIDVRRAESRPHTKLGWLDSHHSFSFGGHYDPANTHHGLLLVSNDDRVAAGTGLHDPSAPRHGDRHVGAVGPARAQGLRRQPRRALSRARAAHERGYRHLALRDESVRDRGRALHPDVGPARHRAGRPRLRAEGHQHRARQRRPAADRLRSGTRCRDLDPAGRRGALGRTR